MPEGEYLYTLNRFFAWYYFKAKRPDAYLKSLQTRHLNAMLTRSDRFEPDSNFSSLNPVYNITPMDIEKRIISALGNNMNPNRNSGE